MKRRYFTTLFLVFLASIIAGAQTAQLVRNNEPVAAFFGADALKNAVTAAAASGDVIVLSSGTFNECQVIEKSVSIYGQGFDNPSIRTFIKGRLQFRSTGEHSLDDIHLEGLSLESHLNLLNDGNRNPISNLTVEKCLIRGMFLYMDHDHTTIRNCVMQGDLKSYPGDYKATNMLVENCWKDGGSFNRFTTDSDITIKNSIFYCRSISGFDNSSAFTKADYQNCVIANCSLGANSTASNCVLIAVNTSNTGVATEGCYSVPSAASVYSNMSTLVYTDGTVPEIQSEYTGIGITGGTLGWSTTPSQPAMNYTTTLTKDGDGYYLLGTKADWIEFKRVVEKMNPMANAKMTADIDLGDAQAMIGNGHYNNVSFRRAYAGIFDGQGHTLTIHFVTADILQLLINEGFTEPTYLGCGPFGYVCGGTIRNLNTAGTITSTHEGAAGIVAWTNGTVLIENCHSSVNIIFDNASRKRGLSGFTYNSFNDNHVLTIRDCVYDGTMTAGADKTGSSGFVIWRAYGTVNISNSLLAATYENGLGTSDCGTFIRNGLGGGIISNSFYKTVLGESQGVQATETELTNGRTAFYLQAGRSDLVWGQQIGVDPLPVLTTDESKRVYRSASGYTNDPSLAIADQSLVPLNYTIDGSGNLTITGFDAGFTPPADYALIIPEDIDGKPVVGIGTDAFKGKTTIATVSFPSTLTSIGQNAFRECTGLSAVTVPATITTMGIDAFSWSGVKTVDVYCNELAQGAFWQCTSLENVTIHEGVTVLGHGCFESCAKLTTVDIPKSVTTISKQAFYKCTLLATVNFAANSELTNIGINAFRETALTTMTIPQSVTLIDTEAFRSCQKLSSVTFAAGSKLTTINTSAFADCVLLSSFTMPDMLTTLGNTVFYNCQKLESITFSPLLTTMPDGTFQKCSKLDNVTIPGTITRLGSSAFQECSSLSSIVIPNSVTVMGTSVFQDCTSLTAASFQTGFTMNYIPNNTFYNTRFSSFTIPASVTAINYQAFMNNTALSAIEFPATVTTLGRDAFRGCTALEEVTIPATITSMDWDVFSYSGVESVQVYCNELGQGAFWNCKNLTSATLHEGLTIVGHGAFQECSNLPTITIPQSVTTIRKNAFYQCYLLTAVNFAPGAQVSEIGETCFYQCTSLEGITFPKTLKTIGNSAFRYCSSLNNVVLPDSLVTIQDWAFANCTAMENLTIEEGVTSINRDVFQFSGMKKVVLPSTLEFIGVNLFNECSQLEELDLSKCVNVYELYSMANVQRTGGSGQWNIFFGIPSTTKVILPPYATATLGANDEVASLPFDLQQDDEGYYLINTAADWDKFVVYSRQNPTINGRVTNHLNLTKHFGKLGVGNGESNYITYQGTLDAQGHTLSIKYKTGKDDGGGLLAYVENATVKNLRMTGEIMANNRHIGGIVGFVKPGSTLVMQDCESHADFTVTPTTTNMHIGGFIGQGKTGNITLTDCLFTGSIMGNSSFRYAAPFLGWMESAGRITYNYCLNNGTFTNTDPGYTYALGVTQYNNQSTAAVCYYKPGNNTNNETLATATTAEQLASGMVTYRLQGGRADQHWGQLLGKDPYPLLTNEEGILVYRGQTYTNEYVEYAGLQKDEDDYYLIGGSADWEEFCLVVEDFPLSNARMTADVVVADNSIVGSATNDNGRYNGIFDGQGHTLTVSYPFTPNRYSSPFANIEGATIKNLHVDGSVNSAWAHGGGLVANSWGTNTLENVWVSVDIKSSVSGWDECGAFVGCMKNGTLNITNCLFTGSITASSSYNGGFIGYRDGGTSILTNCLSTGTFNYTGGGNDFTRGTTVTNCYYSGTFNGSANNITQVTDEQLASGQITYKLQGKQDDLVWTQTLGTDEQPMLTLFAIDGLRVYRASIDSYTNDPNETILPVDADGYYQIASLDDWKTVSMLVAEGEEEAKVRMIADIDLGDDQTRIGNPNALETTNYFKGIFDGQGHTLTIHLVQNGPQGYNTAPFPNISCATIKNVHFDGTITNDCNTQPSIVGNCRYGTSYLENIWSSVTTTSNSNSEWTEAAPFVSCVDGYKQGHLVMSDCLFTGAIQGTPTYAGAFIGWVNSGGSASISNCLSTGTFQTGGHPDIRGNYTNCYVLQFTGSIPSNMQCTSTTLADGTITTALQAGREKEIWIQDDSTGQPFLALFQKNKGITTGMKILTDVDNDTWFTLEGMKLDTKPKQPGVYIKNGKRVVIK